MPHGGGKWFKAEVATGVGRQWGMRGEPVGKDEAGNTYYRDKRRRGAGRERRWVVYAGEVEASRVPAEWHSWLHYTTDDVPDGAARLL